MGYIETATITWHIHLGVSGLPQTSDLEKMQNATEDSQWSTVTVSTTYMHMDEFQQ